MCLKCDIKIKHLYYLNTYNQSFSLSVFFIFLPREDRDKLLFT